MTSRPHNVKLSQRHVLWRHSQSRPYDVILSDFSPFRVKKTAPLHEFLAMLAENLAYPVSQLRPWPFNYRQNQTYRPQVLEIDSQLDRSVGGLLNIKWQKMEHIMSVWDKDSELLQQKSDDDWISLYVVHWEHGKSILTKLQLGWFTRVRTRLSWCRNPKIWAQSSFDVLIDLYWIVLGTRISRRRESVDDFRPNPRSGKCNITAPRLRQGQ